MVAGQVKVPFFIAHLRPVVTVKPGAALYSSVLEGIGQGFSPMLRKPPNETTAQATEPLRGSMTNSLMSPRLSSSGFTTLVVMMVDALRVEFEKACG